jgi:hypothetical protein
MTSDQLENLLRAQPFVPFVLQMADGYEIEVTSPDMIVDRGGCVGVVLNADDSIKIIDLLPGPSPQVQTGRGGD